MSLIADSLKKAVKDKVGGGFAKPDFNLLRDIPRKKSAKGRTGSFARIFILIVLPGAALAYLIYAGAFDERHTRLTELPLWRQLGLIKAPQPPAVAKTPFTPPVPPKEVAPPPPKTETVPQAVPTQPSPEKVLPAKPKAVPGAKKFNQTASVPPVKSRQKPQSHTEAPVKQAARPPVTREKAAPVPSVPKPEKPAQPEMPRPAPEEGMPVARPKPVEPQLTSLMPALPAKQAAPVPEVFRNSGYYLNRAIFFQQSGEWEKALNNYSKAAELDPDNPDIYNNKGVIYKELAQYDQAIEEFLRTVYLNPNYGKAYNNIGVVYYLKKNYNGAIQNYQKAIEIDPANLEALNNLAIIYKNQNQFEKARLVLNSALRQAPEHSGTNYNLAVLYESEGNIKSAILYYQRFVDIGAASHSQLVQEVKNHLKTLQ